MSNRDIYVQKLNAQLDEWNAEIDKLEARIQKYVFLCRGAQLF
jgi:prefoldin subunit 5